MSVSLETKEIIPNFFIVGAPKCGTSSMCSYLRHHYDVFIPSLKEPYFFATDLDAGSEREALYFVRDRNSYIKLFSPARHARRVGEASTLYLYSKDAARNIKRFCGDDTKIIIMVRDPVELMYAYHNQRVRNGNEVIGNFEDALRAEEERKQGLRIPYPAVIPKAFFYREVARLSSQIERYLDLFDRDDIHFVVLDDLGTNPETVYREVLRFLGIDSAVSLAEFPVRNAGKRVRNASLQRFIKHPPPGVSFLGRKLLPVGMRSGLKKRVSGINLVEKARPRMNPLLRRELQEEFAGEVERLSDLLERDLTNWSKDL